MLVTVFEILPKGSPEKIVLLCHIGYGFLYIFKRQIIDTSTI
jgi:hypothetical protein